MRNDFYPIVDKPRPYFWIIAFVSLLWLAVHSQADASEDFKGAFNAPDVTVGALAGLGVVDSSGGFALIGNVAKQISHQGFIPDINNPLYIEAEVGPLFTSGTSALFYSGQLRWDFVKDSQWTLYALGGLGGYVTSTKLGDHWEMFPRFGGGAFYSVSSMISIRGELSHELLAVGVSFGF